MFPLMTMPVEYILSVQFSNLNLYCERHKYNFIDILDSFKQGNETVIHLALTNLQQTYGQEFNSFIEKNYIKMVA